MSTKLKMIILEYTTYLFMIVAAILMVYFQFIGYGWIAVGIFAAMCAMLICFTMTMLRWEISEQVERDNKD